MEKIRFLQKRIFSIKRQTVRVDMILLTSYFSLFIINCSLPDFSCILQVVNGRMIR
jgi:hypothetical protein